MKAENILGADIAKLKFDVQLLSGPDLRVRHSASFANNHKGFKQLQKWLCSHGVSAQMHVCLEATSRYGEAFATFLYQQAYVVSMVNPLRIRRYVQSRQVRTQNDRIDAGLIADFCASQDDLPIWEPLSSAHRRLQDLTRVRQTLVEQKDAFAHQLESAADLVRGCFRRQIASLEREITRVDKLIQSLVAQEAELKTPIELAQSIPGVGLITAATALAEMPPVKKIPQAGSLIAFAGLDPISKESGTSVKTKPRISRMGSRRLRRALYMPALAALRCNPLVRALAERLKKRGRSGKYVVVAAMRKLLRLIYGVIKTGQPFQADWDNPCAPRSQTITT